MAIEFDKLPPQIQTQILQKTGNPQRENSLTLFGNAKVADIQQKGRGRQTPQRNKYNNEPTKRLTAAGNVITFASIKEAKRYDTLMLMLHGGLIKDLRLQVDFTLVEAFTKPNGERVPAMRYKADFSYKIKVDPHEQNQRGLTTAFDEPGWRYVVEDVKSAPTRTDKYKLKRKLLYDKYRIEISEV